MSYNPYRSDEPWEYEMFTEVLTSAKYPEKKQYALTHPNDYLLAGKVQGLDHQLVRLIDRAVRNLLRRAGDQGWEPVDSIDAGSLWTKGRVRFGEAPDSTDNSDSSRIVELTTVNIFCRRRRQLRSNVFVDLLTEANPALKHLEFDDDLPLE